ncbi:TetR/AcrR family transcriptional regulator [Aquibacillus koreensis]|uniref:TetR/AcrR family transcriptional regulator n=1 Tax=Aquibacillus koreensis TaxID=279446 RepID=A0A9X3WKT7_9BACI|nr:TetR/AcrR family transcriptional regulator [Aquibacillus koreensis]MCT2536922.1 TetR/AcrR family transcriptional regulator [Aquibacillus koreensis]MDC3421947.1 TetR/AcrR family transcriptional regulator [Aquibacillus koreensis]
MKDKPNRSLGRPRASDIKKPTKQMILETATELFIARGYQEVSIDDVAKKCNVTKATVYYYYASKANLFTETMVQMMLRIRGYMKKMLEEDIPLRDRLLKVTIAHLHATFDLDLEGFMRETKNALTKEQVKMIHQAEETMYEAIEIAFNKEIEAGKIGTVNTKFAAHSFTSLLKVGNYRDANNNPIFSSVEETAEQIITFLWKGLYN